jgi:serine/threonine protein kinase
MMTPPPDLTCYEDICFTSKRKFDCQDAPPHKRHKGNVLYDVLRTISTGCGTHGVVLRSDDFAWKIQSSNEVALQEMKALKELQSPYIIPLLESQEDDDFVYMKFPWCKYNLLHYLEMRSMKEHDVVRVTYAILSALVVAHDVNLLHGDVKPENVLLRHKDVYLADWGLATYLDEDILPESIVTPAYRAPEVHLKTSILTTKMDIFAVGCVVLDMCSWSLRGYNQTSELIESIFTLVGFPLKGSLTTLPLYPRYAYLPQQGILNLVFSHYSVALRELMKGLLAPNPEDRWSATQALAHSIFDEYRT